MGKVRRWIERKEKEKKERENQEIMVALDIHVRDGEPLTAIEHACWYAWRYVPQTRARSSDPGADRGAGGSGVGRDLGG